MTVEEIKKYANQGFLDGKTKQEIFDELKEKNLRTEAGLAKIIRRIPALRARKKYKPLNITLKVILGMVIFAGIVDIIMHGVAFFPLLFVIGYICCFVGIIRYNAESYLGVALLTLGGLPQAFGRMFEPFEPLGLGDFVLFILLMVFGVYLNLKFFPAYKTVKERYKNPQGQTKFKEIIKFVE